LTCDNCRKRKAKCSRASPCTLCQKSGTVCKWTAFEDVSSKRDEKTSWSHRRVKLDLDSDVYDSPSSPSHSQQSEHQSEASEASELELSRLRRLVQIIQRRFDISDYELAQLRDLAESEPSSGDDEPVQKSKIDSASIPIEPWSALTPESYGYGSIEDDSVDLFLPPASSDLYSDNIGKPMFDDLSLADSSSNLWLLSPLPTSPIAFPMLGSTSDPRVTYLRQLWG